MRVFIAGGTGQLGQAVIPLLVAAGHSVTATARGEEKAALVRGMGARPVDVDIFDAAALGLALAGSDAVMRLATKIPAMSEMGRAHAWDANDRLRTEGARALVDASLAQGVERIVSESITYVYGDAGDDWIDEEGAVDAAGLSVLETALESEREAHRVTSAGGTAVVMRFGGLYSATSDQTRQSAKLARRRLFPVIGRGDNYVSSLAVADAGTALVAALGAAAGVYNAVDDEPLRFRDYALAYTMAMDAPRPLRVPRVVGAAAMGSAAAYLLRSARVSNRRLREATGWRPAYPSLREGLEAIAPVLATAS